MLRSYSRLWPLWWLFVFAASLTLTLVQLCSFKVQRGSFLASIKYEKEIDTGSSDSMVGGPRAFVCITGVLGDLELENKAKNIFQPLQEAGYSVDVSVFLQNEFGDPLFVPFREPYSFSHAVARFHGGIYEGSNISDATYKLYEKPIGSVDGGLSVTAKMNPTVAKLINKKRKTAFETPETITRYLQSNGFSVGQVKVYSPIVNPPLNADHVQYMADKIGYVSEILNRDAFHRMLWRAVNDVRLLDSYKRCWESVSNASKGLSPAVIVRAGEDSVLSARINVLATINDNITSIPCKTVRGHNNDQIDILPMSLAKPFFTQPYQRYYQDDSFSNLIPSLADYLQSVYGSFDRPYQEPPVAYPLTDKPLVWNASKGGNGTALAVRPPSGQQGKKKRALVCITGQVGRLELENKIKMLVRPLQSKFLVDVRLVLGYGNTSFQEHKQPLTEKPTFANLSSVHEFCRRNGLGDVTNVTGYVSSNNFPINPQYWMQRRTKKSFGRGEKLTGNVMANMKIAKSYTYCLKEGVPYQAYDLYVRIRDDVGFSHPVDVEAIDNSLGPRDILTPFSRSNGGINDRLAFVASGVAKCFFRLPYVKYFDGSHLDGAQSNMESFLKRAYWRGRCGDKILTSKYLRPRKMYAGKFTDNAR